MTEINESALLANVHATRTQIVLAITGGGTRAIAELLEVPGGSRTLLEAVVPYSAASLHEWLGAAPEHFCSARTARAMAMAGFRRAGKLTAGGAASSSSSSMRDTVAELGFAGVACTASLVSDRPKRGAHRIHAAWQTSSVSATHSIELVKGRRSRVEEEQLAARLVLNAVAEASGLADPLPLGTLPDEPLTTTRTDAPPAWRELLSGTIQAVRHERGVRDSIGSNLALPATGPCVLFPGAFNPLHDGHRRMADLAATILGLPVEFEISIENVDKPPLDFTEMDERLRQFTAGPTLWFTRAPTFDRKSELFPGTTYIVGADTIHRIADPHYYGGDQQAAAAAIDRIAKRDSRFLVFGRLADGRFKTLNQLNLPKSLRQICTEVPSNQFRHDVSSTALRQADPDSSPDNRV